MQSDSPIVVAEPGSLAGFPLRILAAEDNPVFQSMLRTMLTRWGYETVIAQDGNEAWKLLQSADPPRMAILDWMMPGMDGVELCRRVRAAAREPYVYILLLTARTDSQDLVDGIEAGADDYLTKPFNSHELHARIRAGMRIIELQRQLVLAREELRDQATHDGLTGLLNRSTILTLLERELMRGEREKHPVSLLLIDLDRFKSINDSYGHLAGDAVLQEATRRMKSAIRGYDAIGRYGGEEFLVVLPDCASVDAAARAERIRFAMAADPFSTLEVPLRVTCSIGVSFRSNPHPVDARHLVREADEALYLAKRTGRDRVEVAGLVQEIAGTTG